MKNKMFIIWCLIYGLAEATRIQQLENTEMVSIGEKMLKIQNQNLLSIGEKLQKINGRNSSEKQFMMLEDGKGSWDPNILGVVDFDSYNQETRTALEEQSVNIEFKNQEHFPSAESKIYREKQKKEKPKVLAVKKAETAKPKEEDESPEQRKLNEKFLSEEVAKTQIKESYAARGSGEVEAVQRSSPDFALAQARKKLAKMKKQQKQLAKLEVMKQEKKQAEQKLDKLKQKKQEEVDGNVQEMKNVWENFCATFNMDKWTQAQEMWKKLDIEGANPEVLKVNTKDLYEKAFSFPEIAKNDEVVAILETLDIAQRNLNMNPTNKIMIDSYVRVAKLAVKDLEGGFKQYWTNPAMNFA